MHRSYWNRLLHSKKMIFVIFAAFSLHLLILLRTEPDAYLYQQMWKQLPQEQMTTMQQEECLRYVKREQKRQKNYAAHIQNICENAKSMQLFSFFAKEGSFDQKNLQSTLEQYEGKEKIQISREPGAGSRFGWPFDVRHSAFAGIDSGADFVCRRQSIWKKKIVFGNASRTGERLSDPCIDAG